MYFDFLITQSDTACDQLRCNLKVKASHQQSQNTKLQHCCATDVAGSCMNHTVVMLQETVGQQVLRGSFAASVCGRIETSIPSENCLGRLSCTCMCQLAWLLRVPNRILGPCPIRTASPLRRRSRCDCLTCLRSDIVGDAPGSEQKRYATLAGW